MGIVCACTHLRLNEKVAIKMLRPDVLLDQDALERFQREAQAAVKLKSEYVAHVQDVGVFENDVPFMVMEYLEGHDLAQHLDEAGTIPVPWATELVLQAAEALAEAHSIGIIHRDVKPTNLFLTWRPDGTSLIKVLDFGISKSRTGVDMQLTQTQSLLGTPAYMSPEQMRSAREVDARTDVWSLGTVLYEIIEGHRPFEAESFSEMCVKVAVDPPLPMKTTPPALQQVLLHCLAKTPNERFANMAEVGRALIPFTKNPSHAQILVERMERVLRRSIPDAVPYPPMIDPASKPLPVLRRRSDPMMASPVSESLGVTTAVEPKRRRSFGKRLAVISTLGVLVGVGIALVISNMSTDESTDIPAPTTAKPDDKKPDNPAPKPDDKKPDDNPAVKPDDKPAANVVENKQPVVDDNPKVKSEDIKPDVPVKPSKAVAQKKRQDSKRVTPAAAKPDDKATVKPVETKEVKTEPPVVVEPQKDKPPCDPEKDFHGCMRNNK